MRPMTSTVEKLPFYRFYMLREGTAVPAVWFSIELIFGLLRSNTARNLDGIRRLFTKPGGGDLKPDHPAAALLHTKTWFELAPKAPISL
ncbi:hypothetical protein JS565_08395 [Salmonella enterica subsp. enterica serovar Senftenberg]|nr:hypothetical protein [Salmonella enterica subsp. enterica serovar Senftenberg]